MLNSLFLLANLLSLNLCSLQLNLIDDLSSRGVLPDTKVQEMVDVHLKDMEGRIKELNEQKDRQKVVLTGRLDQKLKSLEEELVARHQVRVARCC